MARRYSIPSSPSVYTREYKNFKGVDYRCDDVNVDLSRFADCRNLVLDTQGMPEKRLGWRKLVNAGGKVFDVATGDIKGETVTVMHIGNCLYKYDLNTLTPLSLAEDQIETTTGEDGIESTNEKSYLKEEKGCMFFFNDRAYIINKNGYFYYDGEKVFPAIKDATIPVIETGRNVVAYIGDDGWGNRVHRGKDVLELIEKSGIPNEEAQLITNRRIKCFALKKYKKTDGSYIYYRTWLFVDENFDDLISVEIFSAGEWKKLNGSIIRVLKLTDSELENFNRGYTNRDEAENALKEKYSGWKVVQLDTYKNNEDTWWEDCIPDDLTGATDNVRVTYTVNEQGAEKILNCTKAVKYGVSGEDRIFISGNDEYKNYIWYSDYNNPLYFPDLNYVTVGSDDSKVLGFSKLDGYLAVHKEEMPEEVNLFLIKGELSDNDVLFRVLTGVPGIGAVSSRGFAHGEDEPLFLTKNGVFAIQAVSISQERALASRSGFINPMFELEENKEKAVMLRWKNYILIGINKRVYVLNLNMKAYIEDVSSPFYKTFYYESTVWDNIPADDFFLIDDELYFYNNEAKFIAKFNTDIKNMTRFNDMALTGDEAEPIDAYFKTVADDDGSFMVLKTMIKRGCGIMIKPFTRTSAKVFVVTDRESDKLIKTASAGILDFNDLDFSLISFNTREQATVIPFNMKVKKYSTLQFVVRNNEKSQGFGVFGIEKRYITGNYKKY